LRQACADRGLKVLAYLVGANLLSDKPQEEIARLCREVDIAAALGAKLFRHDAASAAPCPVGYSRAETFDAVLPRLAESTRAVTEYAAKANIRTMVENHGFFCQDSSRVERLCTAVNHPNFGLLFDMGNFLCADENPQAAARVLPLAMHIHAKDFLLKSGEIPAPDGSWFASRGGSWLRGTVLGHGVVPVATLVRRLVSMNYTGAISVEFEGAEEVLPALRSAVEYLRRLLSPTAN